jgi:hypothetical protein
VVGWTPGRVSLALLVLGFALLVAGALLATAVEKARPGGGDPLLLAVAACCSLSGIVVLFLPAKLDRQIVGWLMGDRARRLLARASSAEIMAAELSHADRSTMKISIDGDDHVLVFFDDTNRRLMIEGIAARYQIRAADIEELAPFEWMNYVGVEISYRIDPQTRLQVAIARVSVILELIRQVPLLFFLRKRMSNRLLERCSRTLQPTGRVS